jgi:hypothetical protein
MEPKNITFHTNSKKKFLKNIVQIALKSIKIMNKIKQKLPKEQKHLAQRFNLLRTNYQMS